jgi:hypothetical protein
MRSRPEAKATAQVEMVRHTLKWWNPHTTPPDGWPRILAEEILPRSCPSRVVEALWYPGCGYACCWESLSFTPLRRLPLASKQSIRRKSLTRRVNHQAPLFAAQFIEREFDRQPEYYGTPQ